MILVDSHVHTQFSGDATNGSMADSCRAAIRRGLSAIAFTDHADFTDEAMRRNGFRGHRDIRGYLAEIERCRTCFPQLLILSGVELGEPHLFPSDVMRLRADAGQLERVHASVHCVDLDGTMFNSGTPGVLTYKNVANLFRQYLRETLALVRSHQQFDVLAHLDYPARYWPRGAEYRETDFENELRAVLSSAARREVVLELNTSRGGRLCPGPRVLGWWIEEGGKAVSLGSDSHDPSTIAAGFTEASHLIATLGFRPPSKPIEFWRRG